MKKFLIISAVLFLVAIAITVGVFLLLSHYSVDQEAVMSSLNEATSTVISQTEAVVAPATEAIADSVPEGGIPLSSLDLTESQKKALEAVKVDVDTFVLTKTMIVCAGEKVGDERIAEIIAGSPPSILETTRLIPCLAS